MIANSRGRQIHGSGQIKKDGRLLFEADYYLLRLRLPAGEGGARPGRGGCPHGPLVGTLRAEASETCTALLDWSEYQLVMEDGREFTFLATGCDPLHGQVQIMPLSRGEDCPLCAPARPAARLSLTAPFLAQA
ncbi:MAG: hypothetical protein ACRDHL_14695 [Candidatus Promineifilaceae bacterium]